MTTIEMVSFKTQTQVTDKYFLAASEMLTEWVKQQPGFISRTLVKKAENTWLDIVLWQDHDSAMKAAENMQSMEGMESFMQLVEADSIKVEHAQVAAQAA